MRVSTALLALVPIATAQNVLVVDQAGGAGATHPNIPAAIAAAADGDTLLVRPGTYAPFVLDGKGLVITADVTGFPQVAGGIEVRNVPAGSVVVLRGFQTAPAFAADVGLLVENCAGPVWIEKCTIRGGYSQTPDAVQVENSAHVSFSRCGLYGGDGFSAGGAGWTGGAGVRAEHSGVVMYDCEAFAGDGLWGDEIGGAGGHGLSLSLSTGFAAGCRLQAGDGGGADDDLDIWTGEIVCGSTGTGGSGVMLFDGSSSALLLDNVYLPGAGGISTSAKGCPDGAPGQAVTSWSGSVSQLDGAARGFRLASPRREGETTNLTFEGESGDLAYALATEAHGWLPLPQYGGVLLLDPTLVVLPMGVLPATGVLQSPLTVPHMADPGKLVHTVLVQSLFVTPALEVRLGPPSELTILDAIF